MLAGVVAGIVLSLPLAGAWAVANRPAATGTAPAAYSWGHNASGELADGTLVDRLTPVATQGMDGLVTMAVGLSHGLVLLPGGAVASWGHNRSGQLGDGTTTDRPAPGPVTGLSSGVAHLAGGGSHSLAARGDGSVVAWGNNASGQLGDGTAPTDHGTAVAVSGLGAGSGVVAVAAGYAHSLALKSDGSVLAWGNNASGQLGDGSAPSDQHTPVAVSGLGAGSGVIAIVAGDSFSMALKSDGTVLAWGNNASGQLGDGSFPSDQHTPVVVSGLGAGSGVVRIAAGASHSLALKANGTVLAWGNNQKGQLGDGSAPNDQHTPVVVAGLSGAVDVAAGRSHSVAAATDGSVHTWGDNNHGQLGDGTTTFRPTPVAVVSLGSGSRIIAVFTGGGSTFAVVAGPNTQAPTGAPQSGSPAAKAVTGNPRTAG